MIWLKVSFEDSVVGWYKTTVQFPCWKLFSFYENALNALTVQCIRHLFAKSHFLNIMHWDYTQFISNKSEYAIKLFYDHSKSFHESFILIFLYADRLFPWTSHYCISISFCSFFHMEMLQSLPNTPSEPLIRTAMEPLTSESSFVHCPSLQGVVLNRN